MKRMVAAAVAACGLLLVIGCAFATGEGEYGSRWIVGSGLVTTENRVVPSFTGIEVEASGDVELSQGLIQSVTVECDDNIQPVVKTEVIGQVIHLGIKTGTSVRRMTRLHYRIVVPRIDSIVISGSGGLRASTTLQADSLSLSIRGSGGIEASVNAARLTSSIGGSGDINLSGTANDFSVTIDGSGSVRARSLQAAAADIRINGSGSAQVTASDTIGIRINGSGDVEYGGGGRATITSSGSGTARQR
jgi:hypothetical protein